MAKMTGRFLVVTSTCDLPDGRSSSPTCGMTRRRSWKTNKDRPQCSPRIRRSNSHQATRFDTVERGSNSSRRCRISRQLLTIDYAGTISELAPHETLEFGRGAQLDIDSNPYLHRRLGRFAYRHGFWTLTNIGRSLHLIILDTKTLSQVVLASGRDLALTFTPAIIRFRAGRAIYELVVEGPTSPYSPPDETGEAFDTVTFSHIPLTPTQRLLIISLADATLRNPAAGVQIPNSREAAARLNWTITTFNRKLDNVCAKLTKAGVSGLHGTPDALATNRRRTLVEFAIQSGLVTPVHLQMLEYHNADQHLVSD